LWGGFPQFQGRCVDLAHRAQLRSISLCVGAIRRRETRHAAEAQALEHTIEILERSRAQDVDCAWHRQRCIACVQVCFIVPHRTSNFAEQRRRQEELEYWTSSHQHCPEFRERFPPQRCVLREQRCEPVRKPASLDEASVQVRAQRRVIEL
jgi:hypothetical protein